MIRKNPDKRVSWAAHGVNGWYLGPAVEHYRCYRVYVNNTRAERNADTVEFFPNHTKVPSIAANDAATTAAQEVVAALSDPKPNAEWENVGDRQLEALRNLAQIFQETTARNKQGYATSKPPEKTRVEAANPRVSNAVPPLQAQKPTPEHLYPTCSTHAANLPNDSKRKNGQEGVPAQPKGNNIKLANAIIDNDTGGALEYRHLIKREAYREVWTNSFSKELDQLAQGRSQMAPGTNTLFFRKYQDIPSDRRKDVTYGRVVVDYRPQKEDP